MRRERLFAQGSIDGSFYGPGAIAIDVTHDALYVADTFNARVVKMTASTGAFVGAIGYSTSSTGTCPSNGTASGWCTGGTFTWSSGDGQFSRPAGIAVDSTNDILYVSNDEAVIKITASTGAFVGAIGNPDGDQRNMPRFWCRIGLVHGRNIWSRLRRWDVLGPSGSSHRLRTRFAFCRGPKQ